MVFIFYALVLRFLWNWQYLWAWWWRRTGSIEIRRQYLLGFVTSDKLAFNKNYRADSRRNNAVRPIRFVRAVTCYSLLYLATSSQQVFQENQKRSVVFLLKSPFRIWVEYRLMGINMYVKYCFFVAAMTSRY